MQALSIPHFPSSLDVVLSAEGPLLPVLFVELSGPFCPCQPGVDRALCRCMLHEGIPLKLSLPSSNFPSEDLPLFNSVYSELKDLGLICTYKDAAVLVSLCFLD